jgi:hypothetical protein
VLTLPLILTIIGSCAASNSAIFALLTYSTPRFFKQRQLRPYVFLDPERPFSSVQVKNGTFSGAINVKIFGQSPAYRVAITRDFTLEDWPPPTDETFEVEATDANTIINGIVVDAAPGTVTRFPLRVGKVVPDSIPELLSTDKRLYIYGKIHYSDVLHQDHWTRFCYSLLREESTKSQELISYPEAELCPLYNEADRG